MKQQRKYSRVGREPRQYANNPKGASNSDGSASKNSINWGEVKTGALNSFVQFLLIGAAEWLKYRIDLYFIKKDLESRDEGSKKDNGNK